MAFSIPSRTLAIGLAVPLAFATRSQLSARRALWAAALSIFAVSSLHLSQFHQGEPSLAVELLGLIIKPAALCIRLFANMLAGHILLVTFSVLCITLWSASVLAGVLVLSFPMLVAFTGFEFMVAFLQAFI